MQKAIDKHVILMMGLLFLLNRSLTYRTGGDISGSTHFDGTDHLSGKRGCLLWDRGGLCAGVLFCTRSDLLFAGAYL